ncbi:MAG TPA: ABC transporter permease subunit [Solirubrobacteraceae bacterium]|jgi:ABC-type transport system involved in multi-copper enzyme maturation permease subunit|nr:ABC transporter permease subunit [Solirubrobacteraceae bacterium]
MSSAIAVRMVGADFLKLRKKRGTLIWALALAVAPLVIYLIVKGIQHSSNPAQESPAGGAHGFEDMMPVLALFFGPLAAILIGTDAGAGDLAAGVFRDLVVTGRSRVALFASRVPAALGLCWLVMLVAYAVMVLGTYALASGTPTPGAALVVNGLLFTLFSTGILCVVAVGFASLTGSRPSALVALIGWQLVASRILENIESLGSSRKLILSQAVAHFSPIALGEHHGPRGGVTVTMSTATAVIVSLGWIAVFLALGAWRTRTMDA